MAHQNAGYEANELRKARNRLALLGQAEWLLTTDGAETMLEARHGLECNVIAQFAGRATPDEIDFFVNAPHMVALLLRLVDRAIAAARKGAASPARQGQEQGQKKAANYAAEAAMKCEEAAFRVFLEERHGLSRPLTEERCAQRLRTLLGISSRKELNNSSAAAARWRRLRADYAAWKKAGTGRAEP
ncbi:hypothetical protein [Pseudochrobactrum sp. HB0163]|uniref:hypothetical protein n=1 Tax=Pseudochrobactrum sp. HB0163 TaxID=3450708 RepID=UPI003F6DFABF